MFLLLWFIIGHEECIAEVDEDLQIDSMELASWTHFRVKNQHSYMKNLCYINFHMQDVVKGKNAAKIASIKAEMEEMLKAEAGLQSKLMSRS